jgi:hypothetical protein
MIFQMAEVMVPRGLFAHILAAIATLRATLPARAEHWHRPPASPPFRWEHAPQRLRAPNGSSN